MRILKESNCLYAFLMLLCLATSLIACRQNTEGTTDTVNVSAEQKEERAAGDQQLSGFWDEFDFNDPAAINDPNVGEQALVDFIAAFPGASDSVRTRAVKEMLSRARQNPAAYDYFTNQYERYLYDPNSPMYNDAYYEPVLEFMVDSGQLAQADKFRYAKRLELVRKNKVGSVATDFKFLNSEGKELSLYDVNASYTLLFFYEPGCSFCETVIDQLSNSSHFQTMIENGSLAILALYATGDTAIWKDYQANIPGSWVNGIDSKVRILSEGLYDLKASPTLYLLDADKKVLLKDSDLTQVASKLNKR